MSCCHLDHLDFLHQWRLESSGPNQIVIVMKIQKEIDSWWVLHLMKDHRYRCLAFQMGCSLQILSDPAQSIQFKINRSIYANLVKIKNNSMNTVKRKLLKNKPICCRFAAVLEATESSLMDDEEDVPTIAISSGMCICSWFPGEPSDAELSLVLMQLQPSTNFWCRNCVFIF